MSLQEELIQAFQKKFNNPSFKVTAELTGINTTRLFRLFNGQKMKLDEYQVFKKLLHQDMDVAALTQKIELIEKVEVFEELQQLVNRFFYKLELKN